jgi:phospholipid transport system substrate-binding protein
MLRRSLLTTAVVSLAGALTPTVSAKAGTDPVAFVNNLTTQLEMVAGNPSPEQRRAGFRQLFHEDFDCPRLGRFVLGRFSRILSPSERKEFLRLFEYYVVATYSDRLSEYVGGGVAARVIGSRLDPDGTIVSSEFNRGSGPSTAGAIRVDWRLTRHHHVYRVKDLIIDGLALELAVNLSPIGLDMTPMALLGAGGSKQRRLQRAVGHLSRQWPAQSGTCQSL